MMFFNSIYQCNHFRAFHNYKRSQNIAKLRQKRTKLQFQASSNFNDKFFDNYVYQNDWEKSHPFIWDHFYHCGIILRWPSAKKVNNCCFHTLIKIPFIPLWRALKWGSNAESGVKWELVMSFNGCYQNNSHKEIKKPLDASNYRFCYFQP